MIKQVKVMTESIEREQNEDFLDSVRQGLDRSSDALDGHTLSRLNSIRHAALEQNQKSFGNSLLTPFGGLITASVLLTVVFLMNQNQAVSPADGPSSSLAIEDLEILISPDSFELYEDFEFYQWLAENESSV